MRKLKNYAFFILSILFCQYAVGQTPSITAGSLTGCVNQPISLQGGSTGIVTSWAWTSAPSTGVIFSNPTDQFTQFTSSAQGTYTITLTVQPGGGTATATLTINSLPTMVVSPSADTICLGGTGTTLTVSGNATTYNWFPSTGLSASTGTFVTANPTTNTTYTVTGLANGCTNTATTQITALPVNPLVATAAENYICFGTSNNTTTITTSAPSALSYSWTPAVGLSCTNCPNPIVTATDTTIYEVTVTGECFSNYTDTVQIFPVICGPPVGGFILPTHEICRYSCVNFTDTSVFEPLAYQWVFEGGIPDSSTEKNPRVCYNVESANAPTLNGRYLITLIVTNILGEKDTVIDSIKVNISPIANINNNLSIATVELGSSISLNASSSSGATSYQWTPPTGLACPTCETVEVSPQTNTYYILTAKNGLGCIDYDTIYVKVQKICGEIFIPTAFSPNGDNVNEYAIVKNNNCIRSMVFAIYNRWGEKVFVSEDPKLGWDGIYNGKLQDAGVFIYYFDAVLTDNTTLSQKGTITLVR
ncbi:MAG: gliding motility-associated C-terminal domain-containing protein [Bacteroidota bacterium]|nr:gliding motility-associated C-terminal domain-containing protein [Bacteroidota bacterium]